MAKKPAIQNNHHTPQRQQTFAATQTVTHYQGAVPHPDILRGLNDLVPGTAERLIKLAEEESLHRRDLEARALDANIASQQHQNSLNEHQTRYVFRSDMLGQIAGFIVCICCIASATYLGFKDHDWLAAGIAAIPTGALIKAFILNKK